MTSLRRLFPWPSRSDRKAAIDRARKQKQHSRAAAGHAEGVAASIRRMQEDNHFAYHIASEIARRHQEQGDGAA